MSETDRKPAGDEHPLMVSEALAGSERLLEAFSRTSEIGFAILDSELRYQAINKCLARINGMPAKAHLGFGVREIFGELSRQTAEPSYHRVLDLGLSSYFEIKNAMLPTRAGSRFWALNTNFPVRDSAGKVRQIGILVIEVTQQRKLEQFLHKLAGELRSTKTRDTFWFARELQDSIDQYHTALAMSLDLLIRDREKSTDLLTQSIKALDQRIMTMSQLVSSVASGFPIDK